MLLKTWDQQDLMKPIYLSIWIKIEIEILNRQLRQTREGLHSNELEDSLTLNRTVTHPFSRPRIGERGTLHLDQILSKTIYEVGNYFKRFCCFINTFTIALKIFTFLMFIFRFVKNQWNSLGISDEQNMKSWKECQMMDGSNTFVLTGVPSPSRFSFLFNQECGVSSDVLQTLFSLFAKFLPKMETLNNWNIHLAILNVIMTWQDCQNINKIKVVTL